MGVLSFFTKGKYREVTDTNGLPVVSSGSNYLEATLQDAVKKNDDGTAMTVAGYASLVLQVSGAFTATVNFEATQDGTNWVAILAQDKNAGSQATTTTTAGIFEIPVAGLKQVRARVSGYSAGAVTVKGTALPQSLAGLFSATINATVDGVKVKDSTGTNTLEIDADGNAPVKLSGSKMELYGVAIEDRPDANTVAVGATFTIVDDTGNFDSYISNGTDWLEV